MKLSQYTLDLIKDIEDRINPEVEDDFINQWENFWNNNVDDIVFTPKRKIISAPGIELKDLNINDAIENPEIMLDMQLADVSRALNSGSEAMCMRANYGTGIMTSLFGAEIFMMPRECNTLPTTKSFNDTDAIRRIVDKGMPNIDSALGKKVFEYGEMCLEIFKNYPKISKYLYVYHPDTQGPLDIAELLWGGEMFYELYDDPDLVHSLMQLITDTYVRVMDRWFEMYPNREGMSVHWGYWIKGNICLRNDSAVNLSPDQYIEFAKKYDNYILDYYGSGIVHFCGKGDHFVEQLVSMDNVTGINMSQPHLNDMDKVYDIVFSRNKKILDLPRMACDEYEKRPDALRGMLFAK